MLCWQDPRGTAEPRHDTPTFPASWLLPKHWSHFLSPRPCPWLSPPLVHSPPEICGLAPSLLHIFAQRSPSCHPIEDWETFLQHC